MPIQDLIFTAGSFIFIIALLPSVFSDQKPALSSCVMTGSILYVFALTYVSMSFWFSAVITFVTASTWMVLAVQQARKPKTVVNPVNNGYRSPEKQDEMYRTSQGRELPVTRV